MRIINESELHLVSGGLNLEGEAMSNNVVDLRGKDMGSYIDANGMCWRPGTSSDVMYPQGADGDG